MRDAGNNAGAHAAGRVAARYSARAAVEPGAALPVVLGLGLAIMLLVAAPLLAQERPEFFLDLDTGGHRAFVKDLAFTPDGELLVSASDDKTVRVWDWRAGVTIRTIRGQIGAGQDGKNFALAISPDGGSLAVAGWYGDSAGAEPPFGDVRLFDLKSGALTAVLSGHDYVVYDLDFSPDGKRLAAGGQDGFVYLWKAGDAGDWQPETRLDADSFRIEKIAFAMGGARLVAATADNGIRLWDMTDLSEIALASTQAEALRDVPLRALAVSPDGDSFATGSDAGDLHLWRAADGGPERALPRRDYLVAALAFSPDGARLVVSCGYRCAGRNGQQVIARGTGQTLFDYRGHDGTVYASAASQAVGLVATAGGSRHEIHVWDPLGGEVAARLLGVGRPVTAVGITGDGGEIAWGNANPCPDRTACPELQGELTDRLLLPTGERFFERPAPAGEAVSRFARAVHEAGAWRLSASAGGDAELANAVLDIARDGAALHRIENDATTGFAHAAFSLLADGTGLVTGGTDGTLIDYALQTGRYRGEFSNGHTGEIHAIAEAAEAGLLLTGSADQTVRLWNLKTRTLIASMFFAEAEWIIWVPQGYYYSSPGGDALVGWHVNQGPDSEARFVRARQLKQYLFSPEIVRRAIVLADSAAAVRELRGTDAELDRLLARKPPEFQVRLVDNQDEAREGFVSVEISGAERAGTSVADFAILSNARRVASFATRSAAGGGDAIVVEVPVEDGDNEIVISGVNEYGYLTERSVKAVGRKAQGRERAGTLYLLAIGVESYPLLPTACGGRACDLAYPVDDAVQFARLVAEKAAPLYERMKAQIFVNRSVLEESPELDAALSALPADTRVLEPESDTILDEIEDFLDQAGPQDTTIVFVAGHGINIDEDYYFIPTDGRKRDDRWRRSSLVDWETIQRGVERAKGRRFMLLDTCHAANAFNPRLEKDAEDARIIVFSATAANNTAAELPELGHGVFTHSLLAGLKGGADPTGEGVRLLALADYIDREVRRLTNARQVPEYYIAKIDNFVVAKP